MVFKFRLVFNLELVVFPTTSPISIKFCQNRLDWTISVFAGIFYAILAYLDDLHDFDIGLTSGNPVTEVKSEIETTTDKESSVEIS